MACVGSLASDLDEHASSLQKDSEIDALRARLQQLTSEVGRREGDPPEAAAGPTGAARGSSAGATLSTHSEGDDEEGEEPEPPAAAPRFDEEAGGGGKVAMARSLTPSTGASDEVGAEEFGLTTFELGETGEGDEAATEAASTGPKASAGECGEEVDNEEFGLASFQLREAGRRRTVHEEVVLEQIAQLAERLPAFLGALAGIMKIDVPVFDHLDVAETCEKTMSALEDVFPELERRLRKLGEPPAH